MRVIRARRGANRDNHRLAVAIADLDSDDRTTPSPAGGDQRAVRAFEHD